MHTGTKGGWSWHSPVPSPAPATARWAFFFQPSQTLPANSHNHPKRSPAYSTTSGYCAVSRCEGVVHVSNELVGDEGSSLPSSRSSMRAGSGQFRNRDWLSTHQSRSGRPPACGLLPLMPPTAATRCGQDPRSADGLPWPSIAPSEQGKLNQTKGLSNQSRRQESLVDRRPRTMPPTPSFGVSTSSGAAREGRPARVVVLRCTCPVTMDMCSDSGPWHPAR